MVKSVFWLIGAALLGNICVSDALIRTRYRSSRPTCNLSDKAINDYYDIRDFIYSFLEKAENNFRVMNDQEKNITCHSSKQDLNKLMKKAKKDWANCLTDDIAYFGDFVGDVLGNFLDFFCAPGNENVEGYFTAEAKECRADIRKPFFDTCLTPVLEDSEIDYDLTYHVFTVPGKRDHMCRNLLAVGPCATNILEQHCPHLTSYQQLSAKLFAQALEPCDEYVSYLSAARIVGITLSGISLICILVMRFCPVRKWYEDFRHRNSSKTLPNNVI